MLNLPRIRRLMAGRTIASVAQSVGVTHANMSRIIAGKSEPRLSTAGRLARVLGVPLAEILK